MTTAPPTVPPRDGESHAVRRRARLEWWLLAGLLAALAAGLALNHRHRQAEAEDREVQRLTGSARILTLNLAHQLSGAQVSLQGLRAEIATGTLPMGYADAQLRALRRAWPGAQRIDWIDAQGRVAASSEAASVGLDMSGSAAYLATTQPAADPDRLIVSPPRDRSRPTLQLALRMPPQDGENRGGLLQAVLDPGYFATLLGSVNDGPDMGSALADAGGRVLVFAPDRPGAVGADLARPGSMFSQHLATGQAVSVLKGPTVLQQEPQLLVQRSLGAAELPLEGTLVLAVSKSLDGVLAPVRGQSAVYVLLLTMAALAGAGALSLLHRARAAQAVARQAQTAQAEFLALALRGGDLGLWEADLATASGQANDRWYEMLGLTNGDLPADTPTWESLLHPDDHDRVVAAQQAHIRGDTAAFEERYRLRHADGHWVWVLDRARVVERDPTGRALHMAGTHLDITEAVQREQALREREHQLSTISDALPGPVMQIDGELRIRFVNAAFERWQGASASEVLGRGLDEIMGRRAMAVISPYLARVHAGETVEFVNFVEARHGRREALVTLVPDRDDSGAVRGHFAVLSDITERNSATRNLQIVRDELAATLAAVPDLLFDIDLDGRIHGHHSPRRDLLAADPDEFLGRSVDDFIPAEAAAVVRTALAQAHEFGYSGGLQYELPLQAGARWFELSVSRKSVPEGQAEARPRFIVLARDVTERRQAENERRVLERQLHEMQKMESIGTLAGGIAHDFNNILAAILGNVALAGDDLPDGHAARKSLDQIRKASLRARTLVQQILTFSRRVPQQMGVQPLRPVIDETLALLRATLPAGVRLDARLDDEPLLVRAEPTQLQQVLMNLCTNAWQALPEGGGRIEVGLAPCDACDLPAFDGAGLFDPAGPARGPHAHVWVADNGLGMDAALLERIFDPFFTTKPVGQGTGLGLSVVHGIVRGHGGGITVTSRPGEGSAFHVWLPLAIDGVAAPALAASLPAGQRGQGQAVLYVDDDEVMVVMVQRLLQRAGYNASTCASAAEALACVATADPPFAAVVSDFNMPGMSGLELARRLQRLVPGVPVLISSGFLSEELQAQAQAAGVRALMKKENTLEELDGLLQQMLGTAD